jgi:hypothetical protein
MQGFSQNRDAPIPRIVNGVLIAGRRIKPHVHHCVETKPTTLPSSRALAKANASFWIIQVFGFRIF